MWGIERPNAGAERLNAQVSGLAFVNPDAVHSLVVHSLGTTNATQAVVARPDLYDDVVFVGSAGIPEDSAQKLTSLIHAGQITVSATHATDDIIAGFGRNHALFNSEHPVDPRTLAEDDLRPNIPTLRVFDSDGGEVVGYSPDSGVTGERVGGHNSRKSTDPLLMLGTDGGTWEDDGFGGQYYVPPEFSRGYLDPEAQSFKWIVQHLVIQGNPAQGAE